MTLSRITSDRGVLPIVTGVLLLLLWQAVTQAGLIGGGSIPTPIECVQALVGQLAVGTFWSMLGITMWYWLVGVVIVTVIAVVAGIALGLSAGAYAFTRTVIDFFRSFPHVALIPIAVIVFGTGGQMVLVMVIFGAVWPLLIQAIAGVSQVEPVALDTAKVFQFTRRERFSDVVLPAAMPTMASGMRVSAAIGLIIVVVCGMIAGSPGLGHGIVSAEQAGKPPLMYALILVTGVLGVFINVIIHQLERHLLHWHPSQRQEVAS